MKAQFSTKLILGSQTTLLKAEKGGSLSRVVGKHRVDDLLFGAILTSESTRAYSYMLGFLRQLIGVNNPYKVHEHLSPNCFRVTSSINLVH